LRVKYNAVISKGRIKNVGINEVKQPVNVDLKIVIPTYSRILSEKCVREPIVVEKSTMVVLKGWEVFEALKILSAEKILVLQIDPSRVVVKTLNTRFGPVTLEDVIRAGIKGPRLPYGSFDVQIKGESQK